MVHAGDVGDIDAGLATPLEVFQGLALEGYQVTYQRVPLSRERTPEAADLDALHRQALQQPGGGLSWWSKVAVARRKLAVSHVCSSGTTVKEWLLCSEVISARTGYSHGRFHQ